MEQLKELIICYFKEDNSKCTYNFLKKKLKIKGEDQTKIFNTALNSLIEEGRLFFNEKKEYTLSNDDNVIVNKIEINKNGTGFIHTINGDTIIIENHELNGALDNDLVIVNNIFRNKNGDLKGKVDKILRRENGEVIFKVIGNGKKATLEPYNTKKNIKIFINKNKLLNLINDDLILVEVGITKHEGLYDAEIKKIIGHTSDPNIDIKILASEYNIPINFSDEAIKEAKELPTSVSEDETQNRVDLRNKNIFTIDCDDTKDRDDAVGIEKLENGNFKLYVNISDVSHYIKRNTALFNEALERNTSHYLNNICIPMFPAELSNGICSLNEGVDRLTKTCEMEINKNGEVVDYQIYKSVINSKKAMKYSEINKLLNGIIPKEYVPYRSDIELMQELSQILETRKQERNYLDFDIPDLKVIQNVDGKAIKFQSCNQGNAEKIIENFMVITNNVIAKNFSWFPFIYRIHEYPDNDKIKEIISILNEIGIKINNFNTINEYNLNNILKMIKEKDEHNIFKNHLLRTMKRARYDINNCGHFALQLDNYCHFTSPIRRIADFIIHTLIDEIEEFNFDDKDTIDYIEKELDIICKKATEAEKVDFELEKEAISMAMAEYMQNHIGEEFEGYITEIYQNCIFIKTIDNIVGKLKLSDIYDDKYYYDSNKRAIIGKRNNKKYKIGNKVYVIVKDASKANRTINFEMSKQKKLSIN